MESANMTGKVQNIASYSNPDAAARDLENNYGFAQEYVSEIDFKSIVSWSHSIAVASGWWHTKDTEGISKDGWYKKRLNFGERIALMHSELSEALEGGRKGFMCDKPGMEHFTAIEEEFADVLHRLFDTSEAMGLKLVEAFVAKGMYNQRREDHKVENRDLPGGKGF